MFEEKESTTTEETKKSPITLTQYNYFINTMARYKELIEQKRVIPEVLPEVEAIYATMKRLKTMLLEEAQEEDMMKILEELEGYQQTLRIKTSSGRMKDGGLFN